MRNCGKVRHPPFLHCFLLVGVRTNWMVNVRSENTWPWRTRRDVDADRIEHLDVTCRVAVQVQRIDALVAAEDERVGSDHPQLVAEIGGEGDRGQLRSDLISVAEIVTPSSLSSKSSSTPIVLVGDVPPLSVNAPAGQYIGAASATDTQPPIATTDATRAATIRRGQ